MPLFRYTVEDKSGRPLNGVMQASDEADLARRLTGMGYKLITSVAVGTSTAAPPPRIATTPAPQTVAVVPPSIEPRISMRALASFLRRMAALIRSGFAPYQAITEILTRTHNKRLRRALQSMQAQVRSGGALSPVMTAHPDVFPTKIVGLVYCGELGGFLDKALDEAATSIELEVKQRLLPRLVVGFVRLNLITLILSLPMTRLDIILPRLAQLAKPDDTLLQSLLNAAQAMREVFATQAVVVISLTAAFIAATYAWPHIKRIASVRSRLDSIVLRIPIWGPLQMSRALARFGKSLEILYTAGIAPGTAWSAASCTIPNNSVANGIRFAGATLNSGGTFSDAVQKSGVFDENASALLIAGEHAGDIPGMLQKVTEFQIELAAAQHTRGRWISVSLVTSLLIAMVGLMLIFIVKAYVEGVFKVPDALLGGP